MIKKVWLGGDAAICEDASKYFLVYAFMIPFSQFNSLCSSFLQCCGDMMTPSVLNAVMCGLDVVFNMLLIPHFGVMGAGMGTALACAVIAVVMTWKCCICNPKLRLNRKEKGQFEGKILTEALKIGTPVAVEQIAMCGAMVVSTVIIAPLGTVAIAAHSFAVTAESFCYMPGYGIGSAATTLVGRSVGAGEAALAKRYGNICTAMGAIFMAVTGVLMMVICPVVFQILTPDENVRILAAQVLRGFFHPISKAEANKFADEYIKLLDIKTASAETPIKSLSGGNQQKVILARWLLTHPEYLILDEPTRGIDVGTKVDIQKLVLKLASEGMSVTFISSETDEMLRTCSRLVVMRDRKVVGELSGEDLTQTKIMSTIAGGESKHE